MTLVALGINHKTAPVDIREKVAFSPEKVHDALQNLINQDAVHEAVILSTCNRTEVYCGLDDSANDAILKWLSDYHQLPLEAISPYIYAHLGSDASKHTTLFTDANVEFSGIVEPGSRVITTGRKVFF